jgi:DNA/RNA endonuclease G, NUC1
MAFDKIYSDRKGFDPAFLRPGKADGQVFLPALSPALAQKATALLGEPKANVLKYRHFSVVMHKTRRFAIYSAANVDFKSRHELARPKDLWRIDPRIPTEAQVAGDFYAHNALDRGHLTRREDQEYGATATDAVDAAADTCHWTNCTPQHAKFNEGSQLWQGLERHILEQAVDKDHFRAQVITGPIFDAQDPTLSGFEGTPYPLRYWKVVAAINAAGKLFATAYVLDQRDTIAQFGLRGAPDVPFTPFKTYQTTIAAIEKLTQLKFTGTKGTSRMSLSAFDPLKERHTRPRIGDRSARSAAGQEPMVQLTQLDQVVLEA